MTRILTVSSGRATPRTECNTCATQGLSGAARIDMNGARATPSSEMLAAPRKKAVQTLAGERPGPPAKVWTAFFLGAASISLLGVARAPFMSILAAPESPWVAQVLHSVLGVALPEETVKILVIVAVSARRRPFADPMDTVVYGAAAGLGFAAYENPAYLVQHAEMWQSLAALRSVLTVPFHGALGIIAGAYLALGRSGTALGAHRRHRDWARILNRILPVSYTHLTLPTILRV